MVVDSCLVCFRGELPVKHTSKTNSHTWAVNLSTSSGMPFRFSLQNCKLIFESEIKVVIKHYFLFTAQSSRYYILTDRNQHCFTYQRRETITIIKQSSDSQPLCRGTFMCHQISKVCRQILQIYINFNIIKLYHLKRKIFLT